LRSSRNFRGTRTMIFRSCRYRERTTWPIPAAANPPNSARGSIQCGWPLAAQCCELKLDTSVSSQHWLAAWSELLEFGGEPDPSGRHPSRASPARPPPGDSTHAFGQLPLPTRLGKGMRGPMFMGRDVCRLV
jgi:hypothetical protein